MKAVYRSVLSGTTPNEHETHWVARSGRRPLIAWSSVALRDGGSPRYLVRTGRDITEQRQAEATLQATDAALRQSQNQFRTLAASLFNAQEDERRRVSRELHDDISQKLTALTVDVETLARKAPGSPGSSRVQLHGLRDRLAAVSEDVRRTAYQLHPSSLEHFGLAPALKSYCADFARQEGIAVQFRSRNLRAMVPPETALSLYRVVQEALRNVAKHSGARRALVSLSGRNQALHLIIEDPGRGFDPAPVRGRGLGLINMEERVQLVGGTFSLTTKPEEGVRIDIRVPLPMKQAAHR